MIYNLKTESGYVVAFLDMLGFSSFICNNNNVTDKSKGFIGNFDVFYENIIEYYSEELQKELGIKFLWISDSIFITAKIENVAEIINVIRNVIHEAYCMHLSFRGGIATGSLYFERNLWGTAVVKAVRLEEDSSTSRVPQIKLLSEDYEILKPFLDEKFWICDGKCYHYDYYREKLQELISEKKDLNSTLSVYAQGIEENFLSTSDAKIKDKWSFLAKELKRNIERFSDYIDNNCKLTSMHAKVFGFDVEGKTNTEIFLEYMQNALSFKAGENK